MDTPEPIKIPNPPKWIGSCPDCGGNIWETDKKYGLYECIRCRICFRLEDIIPF